MLRKHLVSLIALALLGFSCQAAPAKDAKSKVHADKDPKVLKAKQHPTKESKSDKAAKSRDAVVKKNEEAKASDKDLVETAVLAGNFTTLASAVKAVGLMDTLKGSAPFTIFAPTDEAFRKLPPGTVNELLKPENKERLKELLLQHVVPGNISAAEVSKMKTARTANGKELQITTEGGLLKIDGARVTKPDIKARNGTIHQIDAVLMPID